MALRQMFGYRVFQDMPNGISFKYDRTYLVLTETSMSAAQWRDLLLEDQLNGISF